MERRDPLSPQERSARMGLVRHRDTKPELAIRRLLHGMGYRYRLHSRRLPGHPDLVFSSRRKVVFVHGCFWHRHPGCSLARLPKTRKGFWVPKLEANRARDIRTRAKLTRLGWRSLVIWECEVRDTARIRARAQRFLGDPA